MEKEQIQSYILAKKIKGIIFFDGACGLCTRFVQILLLLDSKHFFAYTSLQGNTAKSYTLNLTSNQKNSTIYINNQGIWTLSDAVLMILKDLGKLHIIFIMIKLVPRFIRNPIYILIAKNRHRFFQKDLKKCSLSLQNKTQILD